MSSTRWGSFLEVNEYYLENFYKVKEIVSKIEGNGILINRVRESFKNE